MRKVFAIIKRKALSIILVVILSLVVFNSIKIIEIESQVGYLRRDVTGYGLIWGGEGIKGDIEDIQSELGKLEYMSSDLSIIDSQLVLIESQLRLIEGQLNSIEWKIR